MVKEDFVRIIDSCIDTNSKFKYTKFCTSFILKKDGKNQRVLRKCIQKCIGKTIIEFRNMDMKVDQIEVLIMSVLLDYDIYTPILKVTKNTTDVILNIFDKVS